MAGRYRKSGAATTPRRADGTRPNAYAQPCRYCGAEVPARAGILTADRERGGWLVHHAPARWVGSPVSGRYVGGCAGESERLNTAGGWADPA
jgi:hypothetical protein